MSTSNHDASSSSHGISQRVDEHTGSKIGLAVRKRGHHQLDSGTAIVPDAATTRTTSFDTSYINHQTTEGLPALCHQNTTVGQVSELVNTSSHNCATVAFNEGRNTSESVDMRAVPLRSLARAVIGPDATRPHQPLERYEMAQHTRAGSSDEPARKSRRVEKSIRMRVRWICHSCRTVFGIDRQCPSCGHRQCMDCIRDPHCKIRMPDTETPSQARLMSADLTQEGTFPLRSNASLDQNSRTKGLTIRIGRPRPNPQIYWGHRTGVTTSRDCHECKQPNNGTTRDSCSTCGHQFCISCPAQVVPTQQLLSVPLVERVYRKPRQRVRFHCEVCDTQYTGGSRCVRCGHERCEQCPRHP